MDYCQLHRVAASLGGTMPAAVLSLPEQVNRATGA